MKHLLALSVLALTASPSFAELDTDFLLDSDQFEQKHKHISYYHELADREQSITKAAVAVRERLDAGVTLKDDGTWNIKKRAPVSTPVMAPQPIATSQYDRQSLDASPRGNVEVGGISFGTPAPQYSIAHIIGDVAVLMVNGQQKRVEKGTVLDTGETVISVSLRRVKLMTFDGSEIIIKSQI